MPRVGAQGEPQEGEDSNRRIDPAKKVTTRNFRESGCFFLVEVLPVEPGKEERERGRVRKKKNSKGCLGPIN